MSEKVHLTSQAGTRLPEADRQDAVRFCPKCGREIPLDRQLCVFCENTGEIPRPKLPGRQKLLTFCAVAVILLLLLVWTGLMLQSMGTAGGSVPTDALSPTPVQRGTAIPVTIFP